MASFTSAYCSLLFLRSKIVCLVQFFIWPCQLHVEMKIMTVTFLIFLTRTSVSCYISITFSFLTWGLLMTNSNRAFPYWKLSSPPSFDAVPYENMHPFLEKKWMDFFLPALSCKQIYSESMIQWMVLHLYSWQLDWSARSSVSQLLFL